MAARTATILRDTDEDLHRAAAALRAGELVAIPTETVYGLAGNALNEDAVVAIFESKERPKFDPLIVHLPMPADPAQALASAQAAGVIAPSLPAAQHDTARRLGAAFWPGPMTLVLPKSSRIPDLVTAGLPTVAIRFPAHPVASRLLQICGLPLAAPSANRFGRISPTTADAVDKELGDRIELIVDGGPCVIGVESTVIRVLDNGDAELLRPGGAAIEAIEEVLGKPLRRAEHVSTRGDAAAASPGRLASHYAPAKPLTLLDHRLAGLSRERIAELVPPGSGLLLFSDPHGDIAAAVKARHPTVLVRVLSPTGDPAEAARHVFEHLRELDESQAEVLLAEPCPHDRGLCHAINDRLRRAAHART